MPRPASPAAPDDKLRRGRPRTAPDASGTRRALIRAGLEHLTERGYSSVGIGDILAAADVPRGSFYHQFPSKAVFGLALISAYHDYFVRLLDHSFLDEATAPLARLRSFTDAAERGMARHGFRRGCLIGNLGQEMGTLPDDFRTALIDALESWQARTANVLRAAQADGSLGSDHDPARLAEVFWIGWEGAVLRAKLELRPEPLRHFADTFLRLIER